MTDSPDTTSPSDAEMQGFDLAGWREPPRSPNPEQFIPVWCEANNGIPAGWVYFGRRGMRQTIDDVHPRDRLNIVEGAALQ